MNTYLIGKRAATCFVMAASLMGGFGLARAGILEDDEARKAILELRAKSDQQQKQLADIITRLEKLESVTKGQLSLASDQESTKRDIAKLRGDLEVAVNELAQSQRKSKDLYSDLDGRIKKFEPKPVVIDGKSVAIPQEQINAYEAAIASFKSGDMQAAVNSFEGFLKRYPNSPYSASALYFQGNAQYALKDYKSAINTQTELIRSYPDSPRAPDAMLNIASNQLELKDKKAAKKILEQLTDKYPDSPAAGTAKERLKALK